jgi:hypothetical protein
MAGIKVLNLLSDGSGNKPVAQPQAQNASASAQVATPAGSPA